MAINDNGCVHKVAQSVNRPVINYYQPHRATQKLEFTNAPCNRSERTERPSLLIGFAGANMAEIFEFVDKQIFSFDSAVRNVDFMAYFTR